MTALMACIVIPVFKQIRLGLPTLDKSLWVLATGQRVLRKFWRNTIKVTTIHRSKHFAVVPAMVGDKINQSIVLVSPRLCLSTLLPLTIVPNTL